MSMDNRDYYRDWWRKKQGFQEKALFRLPASETKPKEPMHWVLVFLRNFFVCFAIYLVAKLCLYLLR